MADTHHQNKQLVHAFLKAINQALFDRSDVKSVVEQYCDAHMVWNGSKPFDELQGTEVWLNTFWQPLIHAFPDLEDRPYLLISGPFKGRDWVSLTGNLVGTFEEDWLGIPANDQCVWIRYGIFYEVKDAKIVWAHCMLDMLDVMRQAGFRWFPNRAPEILIPAPMTGDGILLEETDEEESFRSLKLVEDMLTGLMEFDGVTIESMGQTRFWHKNMMWYGPAGTGSTRGLKGFEKYHQTPFLKGFADRKGGHHVARFGDGKYCCSTGWPSIYATHNGDDWMGIKATHKKITMRVMDFWRREENLLVENWVFIDNVDLLQQMGIDVFEKLEAACFTNNNH